MRRWFLVCLCSIGATGGACSARSLLTIALTAPGASEVSGTPLIEVRRDGQLVHTVDRSVVLILDKETTRVGVYLPAEVEGLVVARATLRSTDCEWSGTSSAVPVQSGTESQTSILLSPSGPGCKRSVDGGAIGDGGIDSSPEVGPTLVADGGHDGNSDTSDVADRDPQASIGACIEYCTAYLATCADWGAAGVTRNDCVADCRNFGPGNPPAETGQNSLECRLIHLRVAMEGTDQRCSECPAASPLSLGVCNAAPADAAPRWDCPPGTSSDAGSSDGGPF